MTRIIGYIKIITIIIKTIIKIEIELVGVYLTLQSGNRIALKDNFIL